MVKRNKDIKIYDELKEQANFFTEFKRVTGCEYEDWRPKNGNSRSSLEGMLEFENIYGKMNCDYESCCTLISKATLRNQDLPLLDCQIKALLQIMNKYIFEDAQTVESVNKWLDCDVLEPIKIKNVKWLGVFLYYLKEANFICSNYQDIINKRKIFCSKKGKIITNSWISGKLSEGLNTKQESKHYQVIKEIENRVSHLKLFENIDKISSNK